MFGVLFAEQFDLARLAPRQEKKQSIGMRSQWHIDQSRDSVAS
jgi:hypothetical protein